MNKGNLWIGSAAVLAAALAVQQPALAQAAAPAQGAAATGAAAAPQVTVGATVSDSAGGQVGTISAVGNGTATVDTGTAKAAIPTTSFGTGKSGLVISMTKAQLEAAVAQSKPTIAAGNSVVGPEGNPVGSVTAVNGDLVTVKTSSSTVQLPANAFAQKSPGTLAISLTQAQLDAAAKPTIAVGDAVVGPQGNSIGKVTAVGADLVTVQAGASKVQLPATAFAQKGPGTLAISLTQAQLDAAAKAASSK